MKKVTSKFKNFVKTDTIPNLIKHYEGWAHSSLKREEYGLANELFQHAEHYKRIEQ